MNVNYQLTCRNLVVLTSLLAGSWAQAATFAINFFGQNNTRVGQGQFTVDFNKTICVPAHPLGDCSANPSLPFFPGGPNQYDFGYFFDTKNPLTGFSANVQGYSWNLSLPTWWSAAGQPAGYQFIHGRYGIFETRENRWFFGDQYFGTGSLDLGIEVAANLYGSGTWGQRVLTPNGFFYGNGTWNATVTPIPAAVWLFASGLGAVGVFRRKMNVKE